jgi:hypothetical protein
MTVSIVENVISIEYPIYTFLAAPNQPEEVFTYDSRSVAEDDEAKIRAAALDYIGGVLEADPARMERCLHPTWSSAPTSRA